MTIATQATINAAEQQAKAIQTRKSADKSKATKRAIQQKATQERNRRWLKPSATKVNRAMDKYVEHRIKSDDARLVAAVVISEANQQCKDCGLSFKQWASDNLRHSWESIRKLIPIGDAERAEPGAGKAMLDEARERNAKANSELRARKAVAAKAQENKRGEKKDAVNVVLAALELLAADDQLKVAERAAKLCGLQFTTPEVDTPVARTRATRKKAAAAKAAA